MPQFVTPPVYRAIHVALGLFDFPTVPFVAYQVGQLALNVRVFALTPTVKSGNSVPHTLSKLADFAVGRVIRQCLSLFT